MGTCDILSTQFHDLAWERRANLKETLLDIQNRIECLINGFSGKVVLVRKTFLSFHIRFRGVLPKEQYLQSAPVFRDI